MMIRITNWKDLLHDLTSLKTTIIYLFFSSSFSIAQKKKRFSRMEELKNEIFSVPCIFCFFWKNERNKFTSIFLKLKCRFFFLYRFHSCYLPVNLITNKYSNHYSIYWTHNYSTNKIRMIIPNDIAFIFLSSCVITFSDHCKNLICVTVEISSFVSM
jgi:hypothetical protein